LPHKVGLEIDTLIADVLVLRLLDTLPRQSKRSGPGRQPRFRSKHCLCCRQSIEGHPPRLVSSVRVHPDSR